MTSDKPKYIPPSLRSSNPAPAVTPIKTAPKAPSLTEGTGPIPDGPVISKPIHTPVEVAQLSPLVVTRIIRHCLNYYPIPVNGQLLGTEDGVNGEVLEVASCFALPLKRDVQASLLREKTSIGNLSHTDNKDLEIKVEKVYEDYQDKMAELAFDIRSDCFTVGFYQTVMNYGQMTRENIYGLIAYQEVVESAVMIGFYPTLYESGEFPLKAFKVHETLLKKVQEDPNLLNKSSVLGLKERELIVEIPIVIKYACTDICFMNSHFSPHSKVPNLGLRHLSTSFCRDSSKTLMQYVNLLKSSLQMHVEESEKLQKYIRSQYKQALLQRQITERRRLEEERRNLRREDPHIPDWEENPYRDEESWEELKQLRKTESPDQLGRLLLSADVNTYLGEVENMCKHDVSLYLLLNGYK